MKNFKRKFYKSLFLYLFFLSIVGSVVFLIDPYLRYRKPFYNKIVSYTGSPALYPGVLKHYTYDSLILGTSMAQNFKIEEANNLFKANFINVAQSGASTEDTMRILNASKKENIKNIIMSLDISSFNKKGYQTKKYDYLFSEISIKDYKYLLNSDSLKHFIRIALKPNENPYELGNWANDGSKFSSEQVLKTKLEPNKNKTFKINEMKKRYHETLEVMIKENTEKKFYLFFPPYSILTYKKLGVDFEEYIEFKKYLIDQLLGFSNVNLYDFQDKSEITENLDLYKDYSHYSPQINSLILKEMIKNQNIIKKENYEIKVTNLVNQVKDYLF